MQMRIFSFTSTSKKFDRLRWGSLPVCWIHPGVQCVYMCVHVCAFWEKNLGDERDPSEIVLLGPGQSPLIDGIVDNDKELDVMHGSCVPLFSMPGGFRVLLAAVRHCLI